MSPRILKRVAREPGVLAESDKWRTPPELFEALDAEFAFDLDLAADVSNHLCRYWLGPNGLEADALTASWHRALPFDEGVSEDALGGFLNPPYSSQLIAQFVERAVDQTRRAFTAVLLLPDTHDTRWYRHLRWASEIRRIPHRVPYLKADGSTKAGAMFPSCVAIFRPQPGVRNPQPRVVEWTWRQE